MDRLNEAAGLRVVRGPSGVGKTTLVAQWAAASDKDSVLWITLGTGIRTAAQLWARLVSELSDCGWLDAAVVPEQLGDAQLHSPPVAWMDRVWHSLSRLPERRTLVFDNVDLIGAEAASALVAMVGVVSGTIDCVLLTRDTGFPLRPSGLAGMTDLSVLDADDLLLNDAELAAILQPLSGFPRYDDLLGLVGRIPSKARTAVIAYQQAADFFAESPDPAGSQLNWIESVLAGAADDPAVQDGQFSAFADFLVAISVAHRVDARLAAELSRLPVTRSRYFLVRAVESGFGGWQSDAADGSPVFRCMPSIRRSLQDEFRRCSPEGFREAHQRLAVWAETHGDWVTAVEAWLQISDLDAANRELGSHLGDLIRSGGAEIRDLPVPTEPGRLHSYPFLAVAAAIVCLRQGGDRATAARDLLALAVDEAHRQKPLADPTELVLLTAVESVVPWLRGDPAIEHRSSFRAAPPASVHPRDLSGQLSESAAQAVQETLTNLIRATAVRTAESILSESDLLPGRTGRPDLDFQLSSMSAAIRALTGEVYAARRLLSRIDECWPQEWQTGLQGRFYRLAQVGAAVLSLDVDDARAWIEQSDGAAHDMPLYWGVYDGLSFLTPSQPGLAFQQLTKATEDRLGTPLAPNDRIVIDGWRALALHCQGDHKQADALLASLDPRPWPRLIQSTWSLATGRPQQTLDLLDEIGNRLHIASDTIFERQLPAASAGLRAAAYLRLGRRPLALAELERMTTQIASTGYRAVLAYLPSQDLTDLLDLAHAAGRDQPAEVIGDVSLLPDPLGRLA